MTSRTTTSFPSSARHAAVTSPTYPAPTTPTRAIAETLAPRQRPQALRDLDHRLVRELVEQRIHDPDGRLRRLQHDHVQVRAGVVQPVCPALDRRHHVRVAERGRVFPVGLLDPPVLD